MTTTFYDHWRDVPVSSWRWPNFSPAEIACRGTGKLLINEPALDKLQALRLLRSPLDHACGTASLWLDTAGASGVAAPLAMRFVPEAEARDAVLRGEVMGYALLPQAVVAAQQVAAGAAAHRYIFYRPVPGIAYAVGV